MTAGSSDAELVAAHVAGDPQAFTELVQRYRDRMWSVAIRTLGDPDDAADALQDAFISAFRSIGSFRGQAQMTTWLHRIVVNACVDRIRKRRSHPTCPLPETGPDEPAVPRDPMADQETLLTVEAALDSLPIEQRVPIVLVDVEGYSVIETAALLGIPEGTVKSRCARGRTRLAILLGHLRNPDAIANVKPGAETVPPRKQG